MIHIQHITLGIFEMQIRRAELDIHGCDGHVRVVWNTLPKGLFQIAEHDKTTIYDRNHKKLIILYAPL
jgi:hypothetical protein